MKHYLILPFVLAGVILSYPNEALAARCKCQECFCSPDGCTCRGCTCRGDEWDEEE
jgi:hypothetical protein